MIYLLLSFYKREGTLQDEISLLEYVSLLVSLTNIDSVDSRNSAYGMLIFNARLSSQPIKHKRDLVQATSGASSVRIFFFETKNALSRCQARENM